MNARRMRRMAVVLISLALLAGIVLTPQPQPTDAAFTDVEHATGSVTAGTLNAPGITGCSVTTYFVVLVGVVFQSVTITWSSPYPQSQVRLTATNGGTTTEVDSSQISQSGPLNGVYTYSATLDSGFLTSLLGNLFGSSTTLTLANIVPGSNWVSPTASRTLSIGLLGLNPTCT